MAVALRLLARHGGGAGAGVVAPMSMARGVLTTTPLAAGVMAPASVVPGVVATTHAVTATPFLMVARWKTTTGEEEGDRLAMPEIPFDRLQFRFTTSSGAGGQNVNKVATRVEVRFHVASADWLVPEVSVRNNS